MICNKISELALIFIAYFLFYLYMQIHRGFVFQETNENKKADKKPNIIFILTDDQDVKLGGMVPMQKLNKLLVEEGTTFNNMFVTTPLCCPSRSSILTGRYIHNHNTVNNSLSGNCSSKYWQQNLEPNTLAVQLQKAGYTTYFAGKYLNQYGHKSVGGASHVPPGWNDWFALIGNSRYYNYSVSNNGILQNHGNDYYKDYFTDLVKNRSLEAIRYESIMNRPDPFFLMISTPAPHSPWNSAPQYNNKFDGLQAPKTKSFNVHSKDKHWLIRQARSPMSNSSIQYLNNAFSSRWRTLLSVDDLIEGVVNSLKQYNVIDKTYIIYTSDNGYHMGQYSLPVDKRQLYDFDIRVPLVIRGPGVSKNVTRELPVLNIDIAPTLVDIATNGNPDVTMDGLSFKQLLNASSKVEGWRKDFLVEYRGEHKKKQPSCPTLGSGVSQCFPDCVCEDSANNTYNCVRTYDVNNQKAQSDKTHNHPTQNFMYCEFTDAENFVELYNLNNDEEQLTNIKKNADPEFISEMNKRLIGYALCKGDTCRNPTLYP